MTRSIPVYLSVEDNTFVEKCGCSAHPPEKIDVDMRIEKDVLVLDLKKWGAVAKLGDASDIFGVRVRLFKGEVLVDAIYPDPMKNLLRECCCGSGCCCCASGCYC